jgi:hypothetical protein
MTSYQPMTLAVLAEHLRATVNEKIRWKLVWEFLEEYRWEPPEIQIGLVRDEPARIGDERWDVYSPRLPSTYSRPMMWLRRSGPNHAY